MSKSIKKGITMSADIAPVYQSNQGPVNDDRNRNIKKVYGKKTKTSANHVRDHLQKFINRPMESDLPSQIKQNNATLQKLN